MACASNALRPTPIVRIKRNGRYLVWSRYVYSHHRIARALGLSKITPACRARAIETPAAREGA